jgi:hypothetical protein
VLECPLYNCVRDKFTSLFEKVTLGSMKFLFQLDQQVDISLCLTKTIALRHSRDTSQFDATRTFSPIIWEG